MIFTETMLAGAFILDVEERHDNRGLFARTYCRDEFAAHGLDPPRVRPTCRSTTARARCAACTSSSRPRPRPSSSAARAARCSTSSWTCVRSRPRFLRHVAVELTGRQPAQPLRAEAVRARLPVAGGRDRGDLSDRRSDYAPAARKRPAPTTIRRWRLRGRLPPIELSPKDRPGSPLAEAESLIRARMAVDLWPRRAGERGPRLIIVDTRPAQARGGGPADSHGHGRRRVHGARRRQPGREPRARACACPRSMPAAWSRRSPPCLRDAGAVSPWWRARRRRSMRRWNGARPSSPTIPSCCAGRHTSTR